MQTTELIRAYSGPGPGFVFRLRLKSSNRALGYRLEHGRPPEKPDRPR